MNKSKQIWARFNTDQKQLKLECVDLISKLYMMLGQKPDSESIVLMAQFLYQDLIKNYSALEMAEVEFALEQGMKHSETGGFVNVRNFNQWLKEYKTQANLKRRQRILTDYEKHEQSQKAIATTIQTAKQLKQKK